MGWEGYSFISQTVSGLFAIGAPSRALVVPLGIMYQFLVTAFGIGVWVWAGRNRALRVVGSLPVAFGVIGLVGPFAPIHLRGEVGLGAHDEGQVRVTEGKSTLGHQTPLKDIPSSIPRKFAKRYTPWYNKKC